MNAYGIMDVFPSRLSKIFLAIPSNGSVTLAKQILCKVLRAPSPKFIICKLNDPVLYSPFERYEHFVNTVHYKPRQNRLKQRRKHTSVQKFIGQRLQTNRNEERYIGEK